MCTPLSRLQRQRSVVILSAQMEGLGLTDSFWSQLPSWYITFSDPCWSKFLPSSGLLLVWGQVLGRQSGAQDTISLQLAVLTEAARWGSFLGISNYCVLTQVIKGLLDFTSDMLQACAAHRGKSVISDTLWALCHRGTLLIHTESREWGLENSQDVLIKSRMFS